MLMTRTIKMYIQGRSGLEMTEVTPAQAEKMLQEIYRDSLGGLVYDRKTGEVISKITPDVNEILIINQALGGG